MKHTELPWNFYRSPANDRKYMIEGANEEAIAETFPWLPTDDISEQWANAEFIVKAVNNHDKLVSALQDLLASIGGGKKLCGHDFTCICAGDAARKALKEVE